ncbi:MAG: hypothetical protein P8M73_05725 [Luminiphilus sp.]|nr:hypothetical protein [Luminiphilus sp.]
MKTDFLPYALALLMCAAFLIVMLPRFWRRDGAADTNADWLRLRQRELEDESLELREEAALRFIEEHEDDGLTRAETDRPAYTLRMQALGVAGLVLGVWWLYQLLGGWEDVQIAEALARVDQAQPDDVLALISRIEARADARPSNVDYSLLLAEYYLSGNDPTAAQGYFDRLIELGATSPDILGKAAQAEFLSAGRVLSQRARTRAEQALAVDPRQSAALATLGMNAFETADYRQAILYWQRLRELEPPGSPGYVMLGQVIERARQELGSDALMAPEEGVEPRGDEAEALAGVVIEIAPPVATRVPDNAVLFVFARQEGAESGMPIAVTKLTVGTWPIAVTLDDRLSMAGQLISDHASVSIEVQVSRNGQPGRDNAILWSRVDSVPVGEADPLAIVLQTN